MKLFLPVLFLFVCKFVSSPGWSSSLIFFIMQACWWSSILSAFACLKNNLYFVFILNNIFSGFGDLGDRFLSCSHIFFQSGYLQPVWVPSTITSSPSRWCFLQSHVVFCIHIDQYSAVYWRRTLQTLESSLCAALGTLSVLVC